MSGECCCTTDEKDGGDTVTGVIWNGNEYWYIRNAQNDVIGLIDNTGEYVVRYTYDAWGRLRAPPVAGGASKKEWQQQGD